ncbi:MAG TPA: ribbon-helix-helix protein, CopG family [Polyangiaceae bacterium]|nr:ribbon-helix-helix protein, CopG family [Polyangiaceae bacterium]
MKTIQVVLDEPTLRATDRAARRARINRSLLVRRALQYYLKKQREVELEQAHRRGYETFPEAPGEFDAWDRVQAWPDR